MRPNVLAGIARFALFCAFTGPVSAADFAVPTVTSRTPAADGADHAAELARVQTGGRVLDVRPAHDSAESAYEVRVLLDEGRVRRIVIDVESGKIK